MTGARPGVQMPAIDAGLEALLIAAGLLVVGLVLAVLIYKTTRRREDRRRAGAAGAAAARRFIADIERARARRAADVTRSGGPDVP